MKGLLIFTAILLILVSVKGNPVGCNCPFNYYADTYCDAQCNTEVCNWDGGDCVTLNGVRIISASFSESHTWFIRMSARSDMSSPQTTSYTSSGFNPSWGETLNSLNKEYALRDVLYFTAVSQGLWSSPTIAGGTLGMGIALKDVAAAHSSIDMKRSSGTSLGALLVKANLLQKPILATKRVLMAACNACGNPVDVGEFHGGTIILQVAVDFGYPTSYTYKWYKDGGLISGQTTDTLELKNLVSTMLGMYHVVVSNSQGSTSSVPTKVSFAGMAEFLGQTPDPAIPIEIYFGEFLQLKVQAKGTPNPWCMWLHDGKMMPLSTLSLEIDRRAVYTDTGKFKCDVTNGLNIISSQEWTVSVQGRPPVMPAVQHRSIYENPKFNDTVGFPLLVNDPDYGENETAIWELIDDANGSFFLEPNGQLRVNDPTLFDYEEREYLLVKVRAKDAFLGTNTDIGDVIVTILNVNDSTISDLIVDTDDGMLDTRGGDVVRFVGEKLGRVWGGPVPVSAKYRFGNIEFDAVCEMSEPSTEVTCIASAGFGANCSWVVTIEGMNVHVENVTTSYRPPVLSSILVEGIIPEKAIDAGLSTNPNELNYLISTTGGNKLLVNGEYLGPVGYLISGELVNNKYKILVYCEIYEESIGAKCDLPEGVGVGYWSRFKIGNQWTGRSKDFISYLPPKVTDVRITQLINTSLPTTGFNSRVVHFWGENLGNQNVMQARMFYLEEEQLIFEEYTSDCEVAIAHNKINCALPAGVGSSLLWQVIIDAQPSNSFHTASVSFSPPNLADITGQTLSRLSTQGGDFVTLHGSNFGPNQVSFIHAEYESTLESSSGKEKLTFHANGCIMAVSQESIICKTSQGFGTSFKWRVRIGGQWSDWSSKFTKYEAPVVANIIGDGAFGASTEGGQYINITGTNFGSGSSINGIHVNDVIHVVYGRLLVEDDQPSEEKQDVFVARECSVVQPNTVIRCITSPGAGQGLIWSVVVAGQANRPATTSYGHPIITKVEIFEDGEVQEFAKTQGNQVLRITGRNFGTVQPNWLENVAYGPHDAVLSLFGMYNASTAKVMRASGCSITIPHHVIECQTVAGVDADLLVVVRVSSMNSDLLTAPKISYYPPKIDIIEPNRVSPVGGGVIVIRGSNLGTPLDVKLYIGNIVVAVEPVRTVGDGKISSTHSKIQFRAPKVELEDDVKSMSVYLIVGSQKSNSLVLTYDKSLEVRDSPTFRLDHDFISLMRKGDPNLTFRITRIGGSLNFGAFLTLRWRSHVSPMMHLQDGIQASVSTALSAIINKNGWVSLWKDLHIDVPPSIPSKDIIVPFSNLTIFAENSGYFLLTIDANTSYRFSRKDMLYLQEVIEVELLSRGPWQNEGSGLIYSSVAIRNRTIVSSCALGSEFSSNSFLVEPTEFHAPSKTINSAISQPLCKICGRGYYNDGPENTKRLTEEGSLCKMCPANMFSSEYGSIECTKCPEFSTALEGAGRILECRCNPEYYRLILDSNNTNRVALSRVPKGVVSLTEGVEVVCMSCDPLDPRAKCVDNQGNLLEGWYADTNSGIFKPVKCFSGGCAGGSRNGTCKEGYTGDMCSNCEIQWYKQGRECLPCGTYTPLLVYALTPILLILCLGLVLILPISTKVRFSRLSLAVNALQVMAMLGNLPVNWGPSIETVLRGMTVFLISIDWLHPDCVGHISYSLRLQIMFFVPLAFVVCIWISYYILVKIAKSYPALLRLKTDRHVEVFIDTMVHRCRRGSIIAVFLSYMIVSKEMLGSFNCVGRQSEIPRIAFDLRVICYDTQWWRKVFPIAFLGVIFYAIGVFAIFALILKKTSKDPENPDFALSYGILYTSYKDEFHYWELAVMFKRLSISMISAFTGNDLLGLQMCVLALILMAYFVGMLYFRPYRSEDTLLFSFSANLMQFFTAFGGIIIYYSQFIEENSTDAAVFKGLILTMYIATGLTWLFWATLKAKHVIRHRKDKRAGKMGTTGHSTNHLTTYTSTRDFGLEMSTPNPIQGKSRHTSYRT